LLRRRADAAGFDTRLREIREVRVCGLAGSRNASPWGRAPELEATGASVFAQRAAQDEHLAAAIGLALVDNGWRVLFLRTSDLVQRLQVARRELALESALAKLDNYHLLILDDIAYISKDQAETSALFELIGSRYERRSMLITANRCRSAPPVGN
jgi:hypothetical protein